MARIFHNAERERESLGFLFVVERTRMRREERSNEASQPDSEWLRLSSRIRPARTSFHGELVNQSSFFGGNSFNCMMSSPSLRFFFFSIN
ncbi:hypothetical protein CEXT_97321 [Caerostris extrusa]|uniref:Uncharacterized protein n=1 Tax=Caerostris extrusa TaxID=172846 RepID=A0AAV4NLC1_CAEEX|nr:hypothetical protein CEXT_97321 [Caerostris extrusa]